MNTLLNWNPVAEFTNVHRELANIFDSKWNNNQDETPNWVPPVDIVEEEKAYIIQAETPGMKREDIHIQLEAWVLTLKGERRAGKGDKARKFHRIERNAGPFMRVFQLPENVDPNSVDARYCDGILTITVGKAEKALPKLIQVKAQ